MNLARMSAASMTLDVYHGGDERNAIIPSEIIRSQQGASSSPFRDSDESNVWMRERFSLLFAVLCAVNVDARASEYPDFADRSFTSPRATDK